MADIPWQSGVCVSDCIVDHVRSSVNVGPGAWHYPRSITSLHQLRVQITQAASGDAFERLISRTIFWAYCVVTPISTIVAVVIGLLLAKI